jgi:peptidoglycan DL-endopeptidase CwlO
VRLIPKSASAALPFAIALLLSLVQPAAVAGAAGPATATPASGSVQPSISAPAPADQRAPASTSTTAPGGTGAPAGTAAPGGTSPGATTAPAGTSPTQSSIAATEAQVGELEAQISQQQEALDRADEQYNQAVVNLTQTETSLRTTTTSLGTIKSQLDAARSRLRSEAIGVYEEGSTSLAVSSLFAGPGNGTQTRNLYEGIDAGNLAADVARVEAGQRQLDATQAKLLTEQQAQTDQLGTERTTQQFAAAASALSESTLAEVKGSLAQQIAEQAAAQAVTAAQTAATASTPGAAEAAASQAAQAAQVATTLGGGSAAAVGAITAANDAAGAVAGAAGGPDISSGDSPQAAGLAAVHGAMKYLGVPYVWGGKSSSGVDCSGLTALAWANAGVYLPHSAADQYTISRHVPLDQLEPGDLLFYDFDGTGIDHVVMYVGPTLDGQSTAYGKYTIIQAAHTGTVVTFDPLWYNGLVGAARP